VKTETLPMRWLLAFSFRFRLAWRDLSRVWGREQGYFEAAAADRRRGNWLMWLVNGARWKMEWELLAEGMPW